MLAAETRTRLGEQVMKTLLYFDIFNYPLKAEEVFSFLQTKGVRTQQVTEALNKLADQKIIHRFNQFYTLQNDLQIVQKRIHSNEIAKSMLPIASRQARLISRFPFITAVMASGSISKNCMDEKSDIDFFIVTAPGRLWIARTILIMYKRIFLFNSHKYFCVNYFVDEDHLEIEEKNVFTATELATLLPLYNPVCYLKLMAANKWIRNFFPNYAAKNLSNVQHPVSFIPRRITELVLNIFSRPLESYLQWVTQNRFRRIYAKSHPEKEFNIAFKSNKHTSKNHPKNGQKRILNLYQEKLAAHHLHQS